MNMNQPGPDDRQPFENTDVSEAYQNASRAEPPAALDRLITERAHTAAEGKTKPWWLGNRWITGFSASAMLLLAVTLGLQHYSQTGTELYGPPPAPVMESARTPAVDAADEEDSVELDNIEVTGSRIRRQDMEAFESAEPMSKQAPPALEMAPPKMSGVSESEIARDASKERRNRIAEESRQAMQQDLAESGIAAEPEGIPEPAEIADQIVNDHQAAFRSGRNEAPKAEAEREEVQSDSEPPSAEAWVAEIKALLAEGKPEQARTELEEFLQIYPDYDFSDDLQAETKKD